MNGIRALQRSAEVRAKLALGHALKQRDVLALCDVIEAMISDGTRHRDMSPAAIERRDYMRHYMRQYRTYGPKPHWPLSPASSSKPQSASLV